MTEFTKGPWTYDFHGGAFYVFGPQMEMVADGDSESEGITRIRGVGRGADDNEQEANARLIAAAPELYAVLKAMREWHKSEYQSNPIIDAQADAAIAKAVRPAESLTETLDKVRQD